MSHLNAERVAQHQRLAGFRFAPLAAGLRRALLAASLGMALIIFVAGCASTPGETSISNVESLTAPPAAPWGSAAGRPTVSAIAAGPRNSCAVPIGEVLTCWGDNAAGQLGGIGRGPVSVPAEMPEISHATEVAIGGGHICTLTDLGRTQCRGANRRGELGDGTGANSLTPVDVIGLESGVRAIVAGDEQACALTGGGAVVCWGANAKGQLGDGATIDSLVPVEVEGLASGVSAIAAAGNHACALTEEGAVSCWGDNAYGALGNGTTTDSLVPVLVTGLERGAVALAVGRNHACALVAKGGLRCWGRNDRGQLGDGNTTTSSVPVALAASDLAFTAITAGDEHTCGLLGSGSVMCWGDNAGSQLGLAGGAQSSTPVLVSRLGSAVTAIAAGGGHTCAIVTTGGVLCWGTNSSGQLGNDTTYRSPTPVLAFYL